MRRVFKEGGLALFITLCYLFVMIALRVPFFTLFIIGCILFVIGGFGILFFKKDSLAQKVSRYICYIGLLSAVLVWLLVRYMLSKLT